jgi:CubicO group peptidase (beta-lactamase class C family)
LPTSELAARLDRLLAGAQAAERLPGVAAAVTRDGRPVWSRALGLADAGTARPAAADTQFRVGSITKTFTAAAVLQLRDAGALDLDERLGAHLTELPVGDLTVRRLLSHSSGLQREVPGDMWETLEAPDRDAFLASLAATRQVLPPGTAWHYSNLAFALLGELVERLAGRPYRDHVQEGLLGPVGLKRTSWAPDRDAAVGYLVAPYDDSVRAEPAIDTAATAASGQLWSTVGDLCRWGTFLAAPDEGVLSRAAAEVMRSVHTMAEPDRWTLGYGLGLHLFRRGDRVWSGHVGAMPGHRAAFCFRGPERVAVAVLTNAGAGADPETLAVSLGEAALELDPPSQPPWSPAEAAPADVAPLLGRWWSEGEEFVFQWRGGRLEAVTLALPSWRPPSVFERVDDDRWRTVSGRERGEDLRVVRDEQGAVVKLYWATYPFTREQQPFGAS